MKRIIYNRTFRNLIIAFVLSSCMQACSKVVEVSPPVTSLAGDNVYTNDATATSVLTTLYARLSLPNSFSTGSQSITYFTGLSSDELTLFNGVTSADLIAFYQNKLTVNNSVNFWQNMYPVIFICNSAIEGLNNSQSLTPGVKKQLLGEAKFLRAFCYFYLVNLYGDVPLAVTTDYKVNASLPRSPKSKVYELIQADLIEAKQLLSDKYLSGTIVPYNTNPERVRPTKWSAIALLARVYLYTGNWLGAESESTEILSNTALFSLAPLNNAFEKNNSEAIWQIQPTTAGYNTQDAPVYVLPSSGPSTSFPVRLSDTLLNEFEIGDNRKTSWIGSVSVSSNTYYYPNKYKINTVNNNITAVSNLKEYLMVLRLSEQYLIRAEARAHLNKISESQSDLNAIRQRAGLNPTTAVTTSALLSAILHERKVELFVEWGHRWFDLKRTASVDVVMTNITPLKSGQSWLTYQQLYPVPGLEITRNPSLIQNIGY